MTPKELVLTTVAAIVLLTLLKGIFIGIFDMSNWVAITAFSIAIAVVSTAISRRAGKINYFEAIFMLASWFIFTLFFDFIIVGAIYGYDIYKHVYMWVGYGVMMFSVFAFHKRALMSPPTPEG